MMDFEYITLGDDDHMEVGSLIKSLPPESHMMDFEYITLRDDENMDCRFPDNIPFTREIHDALFCTLL